MRFPIILTPLLLLIISVYSSPQQIVCPSDLADAVCYRLFVPLDHANPNATVLIPLLYAITIPTVPYDPNFAIVAINGGPGADFLTWGSRIKPFTTTKFVNQIRKPFIFVDNRGTGNASLIVCNQRNQTAADLLTTASRLNRYRDCLQQPGPQLAHYSTKAIVLDFEVVRKTLGYKQFDLYGFSYGGFVSQIYALQHPDSIRSMILDSPLPIRRDFYRVFNFDANNRIFKSKSDSNPSFKFQVFKQGVAALLNRLRSSPQLRNQLSISPADIFTMYGFTSDVFIRAVSEAVNKSNYTLLENLQIAAFDFTFGAGRSAAQGSIFCNDLVNYVPWMPDATYEERIIEMFSDVTVKHSSDQFAPFSLAEATTFVPAICTTIPYTQLRREGLPREFPPQREIPALVLFGTLDSLTPIEVIPLLDPKLQSKVAIIKDAPHVVTGKNLTCADKLLMEFLVSRKVSSYTVCA